MDPVEDLLVRQDGVIARWQVLACGHPPAYGARKLRRREWVAVHPGGYVNHTGPLTWQQRAWTAVLATWPAALSGRSAMRAHEGPGRRRFDESTQLHLHPPRQRYDDAVIELAARLRTRLDGMSRLRRRSFLARVLDDVADGTCSVLEHGYLTLVERACGRHRQGSDQPG